MSEYDRASFLIVSLTRRRFLRWSGVLASALTFPALQVFASAQKTITRFWPSEEYTRLVIETEHEVPFRVMTLNDPYRLVLDMEKLDLSPELTELATQFDGNDSYIAGIRIARYNEKVVRLVFDLKTKINPQAFTLKPIAGFGYRLVVDLYPKESFDPLLALVREFEAQNSVDALEEKYADDEELLALVREYEKRGEEAVKGTLPAPTPSEPPSKLPSQSLPTAKPPAKPRPIIVMLDPGHGGEDPGAIGKRGVREKNVVLSIARMAKKLIDAEPGMRAMLTRDGDYFVPLRRRVEKARRVKADLMVSIHSDAFTKSSARGSSVYALSERGATSEAARWLANKENDADLVGGINIKTNDTTLARTLLDLSQMAQIKVSLQVGALILKELSQHNRLHKDKVEQAGFAVLKAPDIPSVLVETAFISNPEEEAKLRNSEHQRRFARSIAQGVKRFFQQNSPRSYS
ncbi:MAG: N-acetylmuramoyl-L-alanine amidase [Burkholderiales bacterium]|jgi:N-acetylmuramoyl-L-alanine amidase|nr:N-acetylmuramoyl-L-alanine amidase [Burkholderiales bacterium]